MKKLVTYFSASGVTARAARQLAQVAGADLYEIIPAQPYTDGDLNWTDKNSRSSLEQKDTSCRPEMRGGAIDLSAYAVIYIGFPIWWGVAPRIVNTFIESHDLGGKPIVVYATSGGSSLAPAVKDLQKKYPRLRFISGKLLNDTVTKDLV